MEEKREGFVKREYSASLAQSEVSPDMKSEETNLVRKIEARTKNLMQTLNSTESITNRLNRQLLPQLPKTESEANVETGPPRGWLEFHLVDLERALYQCRQIYDQVTRLAQATKTDKAGQ